MAAAVNFPIVEDVLAGKVVVMHQTKDGFVTNVVNGETMGDRNATTLRAYLKFAPNPDFTATLIGEYNKARSGSPIVVQRAVPSALMYRAPGYPSDNYRNRKRTRMNSSHSCDSRMPCAP